MAKIRRSGVTGTGRAASKAGGKTTAEEQALTLLLDEVFMQPWFLPKPIYLAVRRFIPNIHLMKLRHYFDDYGCLRCGNDDALYGSCGLCHPCNVVVRSRLMMCMKKRLKKAHVKWEGTVSDHFFDHMNLAQLILYGSPQTVEPAAKGKRVSRIKTGRR